MKESPEQIRQMVQERYSRIAEQTKDANTAGCCGASACGPTVDHSIMADDYANLKGYAADADLGLGCGLPTEFANIREGDTVVDLGSGAGNDCFVARSIAGHTGRVIGVDFTAKMVARAKSNASKLGYSNVEFVQGDIENLPLPDSIADVVVSNCVLNLVPDKKRAFAETFRVLKPGGHFSVSDIVLAGQLPDGLVQNAEMYAGCVSGAIQKDEYMSTIVAAGFRNLVIQKEKRIVLPHEVLKDYLTPEDIRIFEAGQTGIFSITVYAEKPEGH